MANSANLEQNQSAHFPYLKFDYNITQNIVQENYSDNPQIATLQKVAKFTVIGLVLIAAYETVKNGAKLLANALIFLANLGYNYMNADISRRNIEQIGQPGIEMAALPNAKLLDLPEIDEKEESQQAFQLNQAISTALHSEPTERKRDGLDEENLDLDLSPATPSATAEADEPLKMPEEMEEPAAPSLPVEPQLAIAEKKNEKSDLEIQTQAAVTIQRAWRKHQSRKKAALENKAQEEALRNQAATTIQRAWRGHKAKKQQAAVENKAATVIQRAWRDYQSRKAANDVSDNPAIVAEAAQQVLKQEPQQASGSSWKFWNWIKRSA